MGGALRREVALKQPAGAWAAVELTPREYDLFAYLATHAGRPVGRTALLEAVFGIPGDSDIETKTLEKHIWAIRQKIEPLKSKSIRPASWSPRPAANPSWSGTTTAAPAAAFAPPPSSRRPPRRDAPNSPSRPA